MRSFEDHIVAARAKLNATFEKIDQLYVELTSHLAALAAASDEFEAAKAEYRRNAAEIAARQSKE